MSATMPSNHPRRTPRATWMPTMAVAAAWKLMPPPVALPPTTDFDFRFAFAFGPLDLEVIEDIEPSFALGPILARQNKGFAHLAADPIELHRDQLLRAPYHCGKLAQSLAHKWTNIYISIRHITVDAPGFVSGNIKALCQARDTTRKELPVAPLRPDRRSPRAREPDGKGARYASATGLLLPA